MKYSRVSSCVFFVAVVLSGSLASAGIPENSPLGRITVLEETVATLSEVFLEALPSTVPVGTVMLWSGSAGAVPEGWALCDGTGGTPDLRDRFVMGAASLAEVADTGGTSEHDHLVQPHKHDVIIPHHTHEIEDSTKVTTTEAGEHTHEMGPASASVWVDDYEGFGGDPVAANGHTHFAQADGMHDHDLQIPGHSSGVPDGTSDTSYDESAATGAEHLPPYYKTAYIVKLLPTGDPPADGTTPPPNLIARITELEETVSVLSSAMDAALPHRVPANLIVMWSGSLSTVPESWVLCDGENDTPDLRDRFVMGTATQEEMGEAGGGATHTHTVDAHQHSANLPLHGHEIPGVTVTTEVAGEHTHEVDPGPVSLSVVQDGTELEACNRYHNHSMTAAGAHSHEAWLPPRSTLDADGSGSTSFAASSLDSAQNLPPYCKLAFILKTPGTTASPEDAPAGVPPSNPLQRLEALETDVAFLTAAMDLALPFFVPAEGVAVWSGTLATVPEGWALCDGQDGTPDLSGMFIMGTVSEAGAQGGTETHGHTFGPHDHYAYFAHGHQSSPFLTMTDTHMPEFTAHSHDHVWTDTVVAENDLEGIEVANRFHSHFDYFDEDTEHEHDVELTEDTTPAGMELTSETTAATTTADPADHLPPYYKAAFIMKLVE